jgi:hypothetical protein
MTIIDWKCGVYPALKCVLAENLSIKSIENFVCMTRHNIVFSLLKNQKKYLHIWILNNVSKNIEEKKLIQVKSGVAI